MQWKNNNTTNAPWLLTQYHTSPPSPKPQTTYTEEEIRQKQKAGQLPYSDGIYRTIVPYTEEEAKQKQQEEIRLKAENNKSEKLQDMAAAMIDFAYVSDFSVFGTSYKIEDVKLEKKYQGMKICYVKILSKDIMIVADANGYVYLKNLKDGTERNSLRRWKNL